MDLQTLKKQVSQLPFILDCTNVEVENYSNVRHIEVTVKSTDPQTDRLELMKFLEENYPQHKFRAIFFKASA